MCGLAGGARWAPPPPPLPLPLPPPLRRAEVHLSFCTLLQASLGSSSAQQTGKQISCTSQAQTQESATQDLSGAPQCCILILKWSCQVKDTKHLEVCCLCIQHMRKVFQLTAAHLGFNWLNVFCLTFRQLPVYLTCAKNLHAETSLLICISSVSVNHHKAECWTINISMQNATMLLCNYSLIT